MLIRSLVVLVACCLGAGLSEPRADPTIPYIQQNSFAFVEQIYIDKSKLVDSNRITYSKDLKVVRYDTIPMKGDFEGVPVRSIRDFNSGVGYLIDKQKSLCVFNQLEHDADSLSLGSNAGGAEQLKDPNQLFYIDNTLSYAGPTQKRDIEVDEFRSIRTDFKSPFTQNQPNNWQFSHFFMKEGSVEEGSDANAVRVPVTIEIQSSQDQTEKYTINIFDFDPIPLTPSAFDVSTCYRGKDKNQFAILFSYPQNYTHEQLVELLNIEKAVDETFYKVILQHLSTYKLSPLRIIPPRVRFHRFGLEVYSGLTDNALPIYHFRKVPQSSPVNLNAVQNKFVSSSADDCAAKCLGDSSSGAITCLSFDLCRNPTAPPGTTSYVCAFYDRSFVTDPSVVMEGQPSCDHYSKNVETFDSATKDELYRAIENAVVKRDLKLEIPYNGNNIVFTAQNIYPATFDAPSIGNDGIQIGTTSFFKRFRIVSLDYDFLVENVERSGVYQIRRRLGVSIDECARLCTFEARFKCESMSYESVLRECKWSSVFTEFYQPLFNPYANYSEGHTMFVSNALNDYVLYPFAVSTANDLKEYEDAKSTYQCAYKCTTETGFKCKSFNFCEFFQGANFQVKCLLSDKHNHELNSYNLTFSPVCSHFSRQNLDDFQLVPQKQLEAKHAERYNGISVEACAALCSFAEGFVCRSFDFFLESRDCVLYAEDSKGGKAKLISNADCNHYSREYFLENGEDVSASGSQGAKYSTGAIFGVTVAFIILGLAIGVGAVFLYARYIKGGFGGGGSGGGSSAGDVPHMTYKNPASD